MTPITELTPGHVGKRLAFAYSGLTAEGVLTGFEVESIEDQVLGLEGAVHYPGSVYVDLTGASGGARLTMRPGAEFEVIG